jgi:AcrR family transcriptional regulator
MHAPTRTGEPTLRTRRRAAPRGAALRIVQPRARATRDALLTTARSLLRDRDFNALSIADLAAATGLSVGSFYGRFRDKEAFFALLQDQVTGEWLAAGRTLLARAAADDRPARALVAELCASLVRTFRADSGFLRSSLKHASTRPESWTPIKRTGEVFIDGVVAVLGPRLTHLCADRREPRIRFAMQVVYGTCVNAVLNDPGPIVLTDPRLERELERVVAAYLELFP